MHCAHWLFRSVATCVIVAGASLTSGAARSADLPVKAPHSRQCVQAVDGVNGKLAGLGGSFADHSVYGALGSLSIPLGCECGFQSTPPARASTAASSAPAAGHLFWRDPSQGAARHLRLLHLLGSSRWRAASLMSAREAEWYLGRWTLQGWPA